MMANFQKIQRSLHLHPLGLMLGATLLSGAPACRGDRGDLAILAIGAQNDPCRRMTPEGERREAKILVEHGRFYLDRAHQQRRRSGLIFASQCFRSALSITPQSYDAHLGLGITHLELAKHYSSPRLWRKDITLAKRFLGNAYRIRRGDLEPIYFLAEVAVIERKHDIAVTLLDTLVKQGAFLGPAHVLFGFICEREGRLDEASLHYEHAALAGIPERSAVYAVEHGFDITERRGAR